MYLNALYHVVFTILRNGYYFYVHFPDMLRMERLNAFPSNTQQIIEHLFDLNLVCLLPEVRLLIMTCPLFLRIFTNIWFNYFRVIGFPFLIVCCSHATVKQTEHLEPVSFHAET